MSWTDFQRLRMAGWVMFGIMLVVFSIYFLSIGGTGASLFFFSGVVIVFTILLLIGPVAYVNSRVSRIQRRAEDALRRGDYAAALQAVGTLQHYPLQPLNQASVRGWQGAILFARGQLAESEALLRQSYAEARDLLPGEVEQHMIVNGLLINLATTRRAQGDYQEATELYQQALAINQEQSLPYLGLATNHLYQGTEPARALELLEQAMEKEQVSPEEGQSSVIMVSRAWALTQQQQTTLADEALEQAMREINPEHRPIAASVYERAGRLMLLRDDLPAARDYFERAYQTDPHGYIGQQAQVALQQLEQT